MRTFLLLTLALLASQADAGDYYANGWLGTARLRADGKGADPWLSYGDNDVLPLAAAMTADETVAPPVDRGTPECWLGEAIAAPADADLQATLSAWRQNADEQKNFLFDSAGHLYAVQGGSFPFEWVLTNAERRTTYYSVAGTSHSRPKRLYWTDPPYNGPSIDLSGKFVRFAGNDTLVSGRVGVTTNYVGGSVGGSSEIESIVTNQVFGLCYDAQSGSLTCKGEMEGQFTLVYYDSGTYDNILAVQVVEVSRPHVNVLKGEIGKPLEADGEGYDDLGLVPYPTSTESQDALGAYFYEFQPETGSRAKRVYPIRPTVGERWNMEVWWKEQDVMKVYWPFECDHYECDWPSDAPPFVRGETEDGRGAPILIPKAYVAELMSYQMPVGHARLEDRVLTTDGAGWSLVRLDDGNDIWFLPVRSVLRTDTSWFTLADCPWPVGTRFAPLGDEWSGLAPGRTVALDPNTPASLYRPASGTAWNVHLYADATDGTAVASADGDRPSELFAVNAPQETGAYGPAIEAWWSTLFAADGMPVPVRIPSVPQRYAPYWPKADEMCPLVIASPDGSAGEGVWNRNYAAAFASERAGFPMGVQRPFGNGVGTVSLLTRRQSAVPSRLWTFRTAASGRRHVLSLSANADGGYVCTNVMFETRTNVVELAPRTKVVNIYEACLGCGVTTASPAPGETNAWHAVSVVLNGGELRILEDGRDVGGFKPFPATVEAFSALSGEGSVGADADDASAVAGVGREVSEIRLYRDTCPAEEATDRVYRPVEGQEALLTAAWSVRDAEDFDGSDPKSFELRTLRELIRGKPVTATDLDFGVSGAPQLGTGELPPASSAAVYYQNDPALPGYNPNEEHAYVTADETASVVWAIRNDLNRADSSPACVLVEYVANGRWRMRAYSVSLTNAYASAWGDRGVVGRRLSSPRCIVNLDNPWSDKTSWTRALRTQSCIYRDRKLALWFRAAGTTEVSMYYPMQAGFAFPSLPMSRQPAEGTAIPWLACAGDGGGEPLTGVPKTWPWTVDWPETWEGEIEIGETVTKAAHGIGEVWNQSSFALLYPDPTDPASAETVLLTDPTAERKTLVTAAEMSAYGLSSDRGGRVIRRGTRCYFRDIPPNVSSRFWWDAESQYLHFAGTLEENAAGSDTLFINVMTDDDRRVLKGLVPDSTAWASLIDGLARDPVCPNRPSWKDEAATELDCGYGGRDHYALTGMGATNWVVVIENDGPETLTPPGSPIAVHVYRTVPRYHAGTVCIRTDENDILSQVLSVFTGDTFGGHPENFTFEWYRALPVAGRTPQPPEGYDRRESVSGDGRSTFVLGESDGNLDDLVNAYWACRYRAKAGTPARETMGDVWQWCGPALQEGWLQRSLNRLSPFVQRVNDYYNNSVQTSVSMVQLAGRAWQGDVALNSDTLDDYGLIELYQTLLNRAESLSLAQGKGGKAVCSQLLQAAERLHDLYRVLGDEAYVDALNPTVGFGAEFKTTSGETDIDYGHAYSSLFCFDNQVPTLLDEELALLRGRTGADLPSTHNAPYYNRLFWNFTKGITAGEVAYAVNYAVDGGSDGTIDEQDAAKAYPQGHGDAYGHYLSALTGWYRLLRNPNFDWGLPEKTELAISDSAVNVDYYEEAKFAEAALDLAKTAARVVELTNRRAWRESAGETGAGYVDGENAFGYGEWAVRGGYGALMNWTVGNSLLPGDVSLAGGDSAGGELSRIDRGTVDELERLCAAAADIQSALDKADAGLNPVGFSENAIPFDIAPGGASDGTQTHYEQIRARAGTALRNAERLLNRAESQASRRRLLAEASAGLADQLEDEESSCTAKLIDVFGRPYEADVGPDGTYPSGYDGPDVYHWMWMDLAAYGLSAAEATDVVTNLLVKAADGEVDTVEYAFTSAGLVARPESCGGSTRPANGRLQVAMGDYLAAVARLRLAGQKWASTSESTVETLKSLAELQAVADVNHTNVLANLKLQYENAKLLEAATYSQTIASEQMGFWFDSAANTLAVLSIAQADTSIGVWTIGAIAAAAVGEVGAATSMGLIGRYGLGIEDCNNELARIDMELQTISENADYASTLREYADEAQAAVDAEQDALDAFKTAYVETVAKSEEFSRLASEGNLLLEEREGLRRRMASKVSKLRYNDMFFRQVENAALTRYTTAFDLARRYAFLAAKAYDYETGLLARDPRSGKAFLCEIAAAEALGTLADDGTPLEAEDGDDGLAGVLARLDANWAVMKGRLGLNNPQPYATWFSLRRENWRVAGDDAHDDDWRRHLDLARVDDLGALPEYRRYCQPFLSAQDAVRKEPALVIRFQTSIDFAHNFFGKPLAAGDSAYDSSYFATRIAAAGVWFDGYDVTKLAATPNVYLVPVGEDCLRAPGQEDGDCQRWHVVDQVIPAPYAIGANLDNDAWYLSYGAGDLVGADAAVRIRKYPSFRAYFGSGEPSNACLDCPRLVGRSVWNTDWMLVIPAGTLGEDRAAALERFLACVKDIRIGFRTYSNSGN